MATLTGRSPKDTYGDLLQVSNANDGVDSTLRFVSDGKGTNSSLKISSASAQFTGTLTSTGLLTTTAGIVSGSNIISDTDSTDDLGSTGVRWANLWVDNITMGGTIAGAVATFSSTMTVTGLTTATGGIVTSGTIIFEGATADAHETTLTVVDPTADRTVSLPNATDTLVGKATTDTLTNKTLTSPVLNTGLSGTAFLDEDDMSSNSATKAASQQSIKAYVDAQVDTADTLSEVLAIGNTTGGTDVSVSTDDKVQFRDAAIYINSSADGQLDIVADTEIQIAATTIDINGAVALNGALTGITNITLSGELDAATGDFSGDVDVDGTLEADAITLNGTALGSLYSPIAGSSSIVTTGALNSGSITSGFGTIDNGASAITTTGALGAGATTVTTFTSTGIDDNASSTALTLDSSQNATFTGDVIVDTGANAASITINSPSQTWSGGENLGELNWYTEDTSGAGPANVAAIKVTSTGSNTLPKAAMVFQTSNSNATATTALTLDSTQNATFAGDVSVETSGVPTLAGGTPYGLLVKSGGVNSNGTYQGSIGFTESSDSLVRAAIMSKQTGADNDQHGLAFMTHPSASNVNGSIALLLEHDMNATFAGNVLAEGSSLTHKPSSGGNGQINASRTSGATVQMQAQSALGIVGTTSAHDLKLIANSTTALTLATNLNATFAGAISKASGSFKIPHPLPEMAETHKLVHSFVESPRAENLYSGMVTLVDGTASVNIDTHSGMTEGTFEALNTLLTHSSSNESSYSPVKCSVVNNVITINCQDATSTDKVYWEVRGERKDAHMLDTEWTDDEGHVIVEPEVPSAATGEVFTPAIEEVTTERQVMETVETGSYVNLAGETIVETEQRGVTTETTETVVQRQDIDGVSTEVEVEVTTQVPTMETVITTAAVEEIIHSTNVVQPDTLEDGQQWRETIDS